MSDRQQGPGQPFPDMAKLRKQAEEKADVMAPPSLSVQTPEAIQQMVHDLRVHQIELTMQNEELRRAHAEIEVSQARLLDFYDLAPVGYITVSEKGLILESNLTAVTLMGVPRSAMVKQPISRFILKEDQDIYYRHRKNLFETGEPQICELRLVKPEGRIFWAHLSATAAEGPNGAPVCRVMLNDITERKQAEAEKEKLQAQLAQAQKMESVGRLAGGVAHDFNNMLGVILGHTELALLQADENHDLHADLKEIQNAAKRSANTTKQLLAFARKDIISPKKIDLNDTVESMLNMLRRLIGEDIDLVWQPGANQWPVKMDPTQIDQILANLCVNARDAIADVGKL
ncbi:MAG: PAS domain S-box protein, partial [Desulfobacteraceae bacterium]|nr:PAS domain S-box protein [Desulfobacteraceae bacterium]